MIHDYSFKPTPRFCYAGNENPTTTRTYGLEVEVDRPRRGDTACSAEALSDRLDDITNLVYCKHDGSLCEGVELVSHPCSLRFHMNGMRWKYLAQTCVKAGFRSHQAYDATCGLHIHVGRAQLTDDAIRKLVVIMCRYWPALVRFTRRDHYSLDRWSPRPSFASIYTDTLPGDELAQRAEQCIDTYVSNHNSRYTALNLTNRGTVEFRIFRGTLKRDTIIAAIQLVDNLCEYAMTHSYEDIQASTWTSVALLKQYNELNAYLLKLGLVDATLLPAEPIRSHRMPDFEGADGITANA